MNYPSRKRKKRRSQFRGIGAAGEERRAMREDLERAGLPARMPATQRARAA